jgi:hypothetical protein
MLTVCEEQSNQKTTGRKSDGVFHQFLRFALTHPEKGE